MDTIHDTINEQFKQLPKKLQDYIHASDFRNKIKNILEGQPLETAQYDAFENEVMLVLMRLEDTNSFTSNVRHNVQISRERAEKLSRVTMQKIFIPVAEMFKYQGTSFQNESPNSADQVKSKNVGQEKNDHVSADTAQNLKPKDIDMFHKKLTQQVHIPNEKEEINLEEKEVEKKPKQDAPAVDPYREPIE